MIFDKIENYKNYKGLNKGLDAAFDFLINTDLKELPVGKHIINGELLYAVCMEYETKEKTLSKNEAHKKYIDVQYVITGKEKMFTSGINGLRISEEYDEDKDVIFYEQKCECEFNALQDHFAVFFPEDAHMPGLNISGTGSMVKKVVVKVHV